MVKEKCLFFKTILRSVVLLIASLILFLGFECRAQNNAIIEAFVPHHAIYDLVLESTRQGSAIADARGSIEIDWGDSCDGWTLEHHLDLTLTNTSDEDEKIHNTLISWESHDGTRYRFTTRRTTEEGKQETVRGEAQRTPKGLRVIYEKPGSRMFGDASSKKRDQDTLLADENERVKTFAGDILFPSSHTFLLLETLARLQRLDSPSPESPLVTRRVFDGADETGIADIAAFVVSKPLAVSRQMGTTSNNPQSNSLLMNNVYPIRLAFFESDPYAMEPTYEMTLDLQPNGVTHALHLDYGDFRLLGRLRALYPLKKPTC